MKIPSLSELIEECGVGFHKIVRVWKNGDGGESWLAAGVGYQSSDIYETKGDVSEEGATPKEAVAHLWISLKGVEKKLK